VLQPEPIKSLEHLTTEITALDIHPSGELLVAASKYKPKALKVVSILFLYIKRLGCTCDAEEQAAYRALANYTGRNDPRLSLSC
jgi:hypothetical protein